MSTKKGPPDSLEKIRNNIGSGKLKNVLVFTGDQDYLVDQALAEIKDGVLGSGPANNFNLYYGDSSSADEILGDARTYSMFSDKKVVCVRSADKLSKNDLTAIDGYIDTATEYCYLVLIFGEGKKQGLKNTKKAGGYDFSLKKADPGAAAIEQARKHGFKLGRKAAGTLVSLVGDNLQDLSNEIAKLSLYCEGADEITEEPVVSLTKKSTHGDVFALINAVSARDRSRALRALTELEEEGEEPLSILGRIAWRFRLMWRAKELSDRKMSRADITKELGMSSGAYYYLSEDMKKFSGDEIKNVIHLLAEYDKKLKLSYVPHSHNMTKLVLELCAK